MSGEAWRTYTFQVNGFQVMARYPEAAIQNVFLPLLKDLTALKKTRAGRLLVLLAAPPGAGKSTLCQLLCQLSRETEGLLPAQALGLDGFHYPGAYLKTHTLGPGGPALEAVKGCPETYDFDGLMDCLRRLNDPGLKWPVYDRNLHEPVDQAVQVREEILFLEGNWLLLNEAPWRRLSPLADYRIMLLASPEALRGRLVDRKVRGGLTPEAAELFFKESDLKNINRMLEKRLKADLTLSMDADGGYRRLSKNTPATRVWRGV